ncbi:hypothetical protein CGCF415_v015760 [Colletotrichum fructicola]|nr:hypothetical protein CGCF415_v015760 [Colletotrichum fructicola]KAF4934023.1 hypothetical protein CGCF245_v009018 [Colletotrichum fructicola]
MGERTGSRILQSRTLRNSYALELLQYAVVVAISLSIFLLFYMLKLYDQSIQLLRVLYIHRAKQRGGYLVFCILAKTNPTVAVSASTNSSCRGNPTTNN